MPTMTAEERALFEELQSLIAGLTPTERAKHRVKFRPQIRGNSLLKDQLQGMIYTAKMMRTA